MKGKKEVGFSFVLPVIFLGVVAKIQSGVNVHLHNEMDTFRG